MKPLVTTLFVLTSLCLPVQAETSYQPGYSVSTECFRDEYREEYIPGTPSRKGHVKSWYEKVQIPCSKGSATMTQAPTDTNNCADGSILGGLLGAGIGGTVSRGDGRWFAVPAGAVVGSLLGCQIDGG